MTREGWLHLPRSVAARFVLLCLGISIFTTVPLLFYVYHQTDRVVIETYKARVEDREAILMRIYRDGGVPALAHSIRDRIASGALSHGVILLVDGSGRRVAGNIAAWPPTLRQPARWVEMRLYRQGHDQAELFALDTIHLPSGHRMLVGTLIEDRYRMRDALFVALLGALLLTIPLGLAGGLVLLRVTNRRVTSISDVAARIAAGDLSRRIDASGEGDAFARLADTINAMLERIESLVGELRLVTDGLAHDLRTPLTRMRMHIEKAATDEDADSRGKSLEAISHEIDCMLRMISSTLEISRTEAGLGRENFVEFDVGELLKDLCEMYHPLAEEIGVSLEHDGQSDTGYVGNRELLGQAVSNLIDNALKYASAGGEIRLGIDDCESSIRLWVADRGPGIPEAHRDQALRKYGRLEQARTTEGSGLGMALARSVARLHGGDMELQDNQPGLRVVMVLPRAQSGA